MSRIINVARLQMNKRDVAFLVPATIVGVVLIISAIILIALQRAGLDPAAPEFAEGARGNAGMVWSLPGFLIYFGVQAVSTTFPFAMALGVTRRNFVIGTALSNVVISLYITAMMTVLLFVELATGHWFANIYALDIYAFGSGDPVVLAVTVFLGAFASMSIGGIFAAVWVRFGNKGPTFLGLALGLVLTVLLLVLVPYAAQIFEHVTRPSLALVGVCISVVALVGTWVVMRRTSVR